MTGERFIDTSFLVRYFTDDIPEQADIAQKIIESNEKIFVNSIIILECAYVLTKIYNYPRADVIDTLALFLQRKNIEMVDISKELAASAILKGKAHANWSFGDALIKASMQDYGIKEIYSFDKKIQDDNIKAISSVAKKR